VAARDITSLSALPAWSTGGRVRVERLTPNFETELESLLSMDRAQNLFLLGFLDAGALERAAWYGTINNDNRLCAVTLVLHDRLAVPYAADAREIAPIGRHLRGLHPPCMVVGPRAAADVLWGTWASPMIPDRFYDQRLYVCARTVAETPLPGFRRALMREWRQVAHNSGLMEEEDLGRNPAHEDPDLHGRVVRDRIQGGRTWVWEVGGRIVFQITVGTRTPLGCQVGGTYVAPDRRGQGLGSRGMAEICRVLLPQHRLVTLHVNEANTPAVRCYERAGFDRHAPFRLVLPPAEAP
jgi:ribosomal protein S18 acetylase RimI-like enzyme